MSEKKEYPKHIGIILDGNRRWAKKRGLMPWEGHKVGASKWTDLKQWILDLDIKEMTLYCLSLQNFEREKKEVFFLLRVFEDAFHEIIEDPDIDKHQVQINHVGKLKMLPKSLQEIILKLKNKTKKYKKHIVNFCMAYGGQEEIIDAIKKVYKTAQNKINSLTPELFRHFLNVSSYPDLIIRTSGEIRTSNFLVFQQAYSEWFFPSTFWPDFTKADLVKIIDEYMGKRERRFGR